VVSSDAGRVSATTFFWTLEMAILEAFLHKCGAMSWFFDGEIVVECR
jgi:hypothetical protein